MRYLKMLGLLVAAGAALAAFAASASATILTSPEGHIWGGFNHASAGTTELHGEAFSVNCKSSTVGMSVSSQGAGVTVKGSLSTLSFSECSFPVTVLSKGGYELHGLGNGNGTFTSTGSEITIHGPFGINCIYKTSGTDIGTLTGSKSTKATAKLDLDSSLIPRTGDSAFCGANGEWTGSYTVTAPDYLDVD